ncbi:MAG: type II secretion system F family protein [Nitrospira sp.]|nr:type II secretion system F family protein [Nitrospira sp.]MCP9442679.1 type II secretion system F family protein [Nitrospira sp.]
MLTDSSASVFWAVGIALAVACCCIGLLLVGNEWARLRRWRRLLQTSSGAGKTGAHRPRWSTRLFDLSRRIGEHGLKRMSSVPVDWKDLLTIAGYRRAEAVASLVGFKCLIAGACLILGLMGLVATVLTDGESTASSILCLFGFALTPVGWFLPDWGLRYSARRRQAQLQRAVPDFLDLLLVTIEAGLPLLSALDRIARILGLTHPELGNELRQLVFDLRTSRSRAHALRSFAARTQVDAINSLTSVLIQTERFGVSLARTLRLHAEALRRKQQLQAEELAGTLPVKLLFPLIFFIFPAIFVVLLGPAVVQGIETLSSMLAP